MSTKRTLQTTLLTTLVASLLSACGGGGGYDDDPPAPPPAQQKQAPQIMGLQDQSMNQDTSTPMLPFQVSDADSGASALTVTALSSDTSVIPEEGIALDGSGGSRTLQITPAADVIGEATVTIRAVDPDGLSAERIVRVTVNGVFVSFRGMTNEVFVMAEEDDERSMSGFTVTPDADDDPTAFDNLLQ
jgi:hypothetical protein